MTKPGLNGRAFYFRRKEVLVIARPEARVARTEPQGPVAATMMPLAAVAPTAWLPAQVPNLAPQQELAMSEQPVPASMLRAEASMQQVLGRALQAWKQVQPEPAQPRLLRAASAQASRLGPDRPSAAALSVWLRASARL
jgi:hypothetical protein